MWTYHEYKYIINNNELHMLVVNTFYKYTTWCSGKRDRYKYDVIGRFLFPEGFRTVERVRC